MTDQLEWHDVRHLEAAEGWLGLGDVAEAKLELDAIPVQKHSHPTVLQVRYLICARERQWEVCVDLAGSMVTLEPAVPFGWIQRSYALHELKRTREALDQLLPAAKRFPADATLHYNLACYECVLGNLEKAKQRLFETFRIAAAENCLKEYQSIASEDSDLKPLWEFLDSLPET
jgi:tetratricopeptide (TPR) repeat protein